MGFFLNFNSLSRADIEKSQRSPQSSPQDARFTARGHDGGITDLGCYQMGNKGKVYGHGLQDTEFPKLPSLKVYRELQTSEFYPDSVLPIDKSLLQLIKQDHPPLV